MENGEKQKLVEPDILQYTNYRVFLRDYYEYKKKTSTAFSLRFFAEKAGLSSHAHLKLAIDGKRNIISAFIEPAPYGIALALSIPVFLFHARAISPKVRHRPDKGAVFARCPFAEHALHPDASGTAICGIDRLAIAFIIKRKRSVQFSILASEHFEQMTVFRKTLQVG